MLPYFLTDQMQEDLADLHITENAIERTWSEVQEDPLFCRCKIIGQKLYVQGKGLQTTRAMVLLSALRQIIKEGGSSPIEGIFYLGDCLDREREAPIFTFSAPASLKHKVLIPDCEALNPQARRYLMRTMRKASLNHPWKSKEDKLFWRGAATGGIFFTKTEVHERNWSRFPRCQLVSLSRSYPEKMDAQFVAIPRETAEREEIQKCFPIVPKAHPVEHLKYKYLIDVDGHSCSYSRTYWILLSNSLLLKQESDKRQWYYKGLQPFEHFIPVAYDLQDIHEKLRWCGEHPQKVHAIVQAATQLAENWLGYETNLMYLRSTLQEYAECLQYRPLWKGEKAIEQKWRVRHMVFQLKGGLSQWIKKQPIA